MRRYHFNYRRPGNCSGKPVDWGVAHEAELPFVFGNPSLGSPCTDFTARGAAISREIQRRWAGLAAGTLAVEAWPIYNSSTDVDVVFGPAGSQGAVGLEAGRRSAACDSWDAVALRRYGK